MELDLQKLERLELRLVGESATLEHLREKLALARREVMEQRRVATLTIRNARVSRDLAREVVGIGPATADAFVIAYEKNPALYDVRISKLQDEHIAKAFEGLRNALAKCSATEEQLAEADRRFLALNGTIVRLREFVRSTTALAGQTVAMPVFRGASV